MDPVTLVRAARYDFAQKNDLFIPFAHGDVEIRYPFSFRGELGQLVVMGREERPRPDFVVEEFGYAPSDGKSIESGRAAANLVEDHEAALARVVNDVRGLVHLDHEGRLAARKIVARSDSGKNTVHQADLRARGRNETPDLRHQDNQRHLADVG